MSKQGRVIRNILALLVSQAGTWTVTLVLTLVIPPYLGANLYGLYAFALTYAGFFALGMSLGMGTYLTWRIARDPGHAARLTFNTLMLQIPLGLIFGSLAVALLPLMDHDRIAIILVSIVTASVVISTLSGTCIAALAGFQIMRVPSFISVGTSAFSAILAIVIVHMHGTVIMLAGAVLAGQVVNLVVMLVYAQRILHMRPQVELRLWPRLIGGGMPFFMWSAVLLFYGQVDVIMLKAMVGDAVVGWYAAAARIVSIPAFLPTIVGMAVMPALSHERSAASPHFQRLASRALRLVAVVTIPASVGLAVVSRYLLGFLHYPSSFAPVIPLVIILAVNMPLIGVDMVLGTVLIGVGKQRAWTGIGVLAGVLNPLVNLWAIPVAQHQYGNGAIGAALVTLMTEFVMFFGAVYLCPSGVFGWSDVSYVARCVLASLVMIPAVNSIAGTGTASLLTAVAYGALIYGCVAYAARIVTPADLKAIGSVVQSRVNWGNHKQSVKLWTNQLVGVVKTNVHQVRSFNERQARNLFHSILRAAAVVWQVPLVRATLLSLVRCIAWAAGLVIPIVSAIRALLAEEPVFSATGQNDQSAEIFTDEQITAPFEVPDFALPQREYSGSQT